MSAALTPLYIGNQIADANGGATLLMLLRWQELITRFLIVPTLAQVNDALSSDAIPTTALATTKTGAQYRVSWYVRKIVADGISSSLQVTIGWQHRGVPLTHDGAALTVDAVTTEESGSIVVYADALSDLTYRVAYASNTVHRMQYALSVSVEWLG